MGLEDALNSLTGELRRRRSGDSGYNGDGESDSSSHDMSDHDEVEDLHDEHHDDDCMDANGDGHCDGDDD